MTEIRHQGIRAFEQGSFTAAYGRQDIQALKRAYNELAESEGIFDVICTDADLALMNGMIRADVYAKPAPPDPGDNAATFKIYEVDTKLFTEQSKAIRHCKKQLVQVLDHAAKKVIDEPLHGTLRRSCLDIITLLTAEYAGMTHREIAECEEEYRTEVWDGLMPLPEFISRSQDKVAFLTLHGSAPSDSQQITNLQNAVRNVTGFSTLANPAFFNEAPTLVLQTMATLIDVYRRVYRGQYVKGTAAEHGMTVNQVAAKTSTAKPSQVNAQEQGLSATQVTQMISTAINKALNKGGGRHGQDRPKRLDKDQSDKSDDHCHVHPYGTHTWADCRNNIKRK